jgi:hypothetical protein
MENSNEENIEDTGFELGDKIHIIGGRYDGTRGRIYYLDENLIKILPDGVADRLVELVIEDGFLKEEYDIEELFVVTKRTNPAFVVQQDYRVGQLAEAFNGPEGNPVGQFVIVEVSEKEDSIKVKDKNDDIISLEFNNVGIPLDTGIDVLRGREIPTPLNSTNEDEENDDGLLDEEEELLEIEEDDVFGEIKEIVSSERNYSDNVQRSDMLQDLISKLNLKEQKSPKRLQEIRRLTELCLLLRNELVLYSKNGAPLSKKETSYDTILDLVTSQYNNFSKPVADVNRVVYLDRVEDAENPTETTLSIAIRYLIDTIKNENEYASTKFVGNQNVVSGDILPNWYIGWDKYNNEHFISYNTKGDQGASTFLQDKDFFRAPYPDDIEIPNVDGLPKVPDSGTSSKGYDLESPTVTLGNISSVLYSVLRGLKGRVGRLKETQEERLLESPEEAVITSYLLFPKIYEREFGSTRSGKLAYDIGRGLIRRRTIDDIIKEQDGISSIPSAGSILAVSSKTSVTGNVVIEDWLKNIPLVLYGLGDALIELKSYGFYQKEFSFEQQTVLLEKVDTTIAHIKSHITYIREKISEELKTIVFTNKNLINEERYEEIFTILNSEPIINQYISVIQKRIPFYKKNDVAIFAALNMYVQNLMYATIAGFPEGLARFRNEFVNKQFIETLHEALLISIKNEDALYKPDINSCQHINDLVKIRKVKENDGRMQLLSKFLTQYQAYKKDNWIYCVSCTKPCLCNHEQLLLKEYLHPREKETIHKELLIRFSGGVFQGKFICNNCGQAIANLEFDNSLEYSDDGAPLVGRSELVDKEAIEQDEIDEMLGVPVGNIEEIKFDTEAKTLYYQKTRELFDRIGIFPNAAGYIFIVNGVDATVNRRPTREQYVAAEKERQKKQKGVKAQDYDIYRNRIIIASILTYAILEIQTHIPNYIPRFSTYGCTVDLRGYPLGKEGDKRIIEFMACVTNIILVAKSNDSSDDPWFLSRFLEERSDKKRQELIIKYIESLLKEILVFSDVQNLISKKKEYILATFGKAEISEGLQESIPNGFTPFLYKEPEEVIIAEAANIHEKVRGYILETHKHAHETVKKELSPYSERTCCYNDINKPLDFWKSKTLVSLPPKDTPKGPINSHSGFTFELRKAERLDFSVSKEDYYKLFLKVCYQGAMLGLPHQPGYNSICSYCGFKMPSNTEQGEQSLKEQSVEINDASFQKLLNAVHLANSVEPEKKINIEVGNELFQILYSIQPSPFEEWRELINETLMNLIKLDKTANDADFAVAYGRISSYAIQTSRELKDFIGENDANIIEQMLDQPVRQVIESLESSILIPLSRILKGFNLKQLDIPADYNLDKLIITDIKKFISLHTDFLNPLKEKVNGFAKSKIQYATEQLSSFIRVFQKYVRIPLLLGGKIGLQYILQSGILGILRDMLDPNVIAPTNLQNNTSLDSSTNAPKQILKALVQKYKQERFRLTDEDIRIEIAKRNEKEKMEIIGRFDRMSKEEKSLELVKKKLGLGDWAVGGTKAIYQYNAEQYEKDRNQRIEMGFTDFPDVSEAQTQDNFYKQNSAGAMVQMAEDDF